MVCARFAAARWGVRYCSLMFNNIVVTILDYYTNNKLQIKRKRLENESSASVFYYIIQYAYSVCVCVRIWEKRGIRVRLKMDSDRKWLARSRRRDGRVIYRTDLMNVISFIIFTSIQIIVWSVWHPHEPFYNGSMALSYFPWARLI